MMKLSERLAEIVRIDRDIAAMRDEPQGNVISFSDRKPDTELHRQRAAHVAALRAYRPTGASH